MATNFIIVSDDYLALEDKIEEIKNEFKITSDTITYSLDDEGIYALIDELTTISLFDDAKFIVVKEAAELLTKNDKAILALVRAMNDVNSNNVLILVFMNFVDYSNEQYQKIKKYSSFLEIKTKNIKFDEYAKNAFKDEGFQISDDSIMLLVSYADTLSKLRGFIDQLICYRYDIKEVHKNDILDIVAAPLDDNVYDLINAVLVNDKKLMLKCYNDMKLKSMQASNLVSMLLNKFQELYNVSILVKGGMNQATIAEIFNVSSGRAYYMIKNVKENGIEQIKKHLDLLNDLDYKIKTGRIEQNLGLELYFLN